MTNCNTKPLFEAGKARVHEIAQDLARVQFILDLMTEGERRGIVLEPIEHDFLLRVYSEHRNATAPDIHPGDRNIIDSLRTQYVDLLNS